MLGLVRIGETERCDIREQAERFPERLTDYVQQLAALQIVIGITFRAIEQMYTLCICPV